NRAYAHARAASDAARALAEADEAVRLRPDVPGFRHTRAVALLAVGRLDDAIVELEDVWNQLDEEAPPPLEAGRCYRLRRAGRRRGGTAPARASSARGGWVAPGPRGADRRAGPAGGAP